MSGHPIQITDTDVAAIGEEAPVGAGKSLESIADLHQRQAEMYAGGPMGPVADLLSDDVVWHVPGDSPIAGEHRGWDAVLQYFAARQELARETMRMHPEEVVAASREVVIQLVEEAVLLDREVASWRTVGIYRVEGGRVREAWLVPLDLELFDRTWTALDRVPRHKRD
jgi:ketosteroid isomerase-like protein